MFRVVIGMARGVDNAIRPYFQTGRDIFHRLTLPLHKTTVVFEVVITFSSFQVP